MKITKRQIKKIIAESVYASKNMQRVGYSHDKFLDREREKKYRQSPEYYDKKTIERSIDLLGIITENDTEELEYYLEELGTDDIAAVIDIYSEVINTLKAIK